MLLSAADVKDCMQKVKTLKYGEEVCYNGTLVIQAFSSGLEIGSCNWTINGPKRTIVYLSNSIFTSATAMDFDYHPLQGSDMVIYSDFSTWNLTDDIDNENNCSGPAVRDFSTIRFFPFTCLLPYLYVVFSTASLINLKQFLLLLRLKR